MMPFSIAQLEMRQQRGKRKDCPLSDIVILEIGLTQTCNPNQERIIRLKFQWSLEPQNIQLLHQMSRRSKRSAISCRESGPNLQRILKLSHKSLSTYQFITPILL